MSREAN